MTFILTAISCPSNAVSIDPEGLVSEKEKIETTHRTRSGKQFRYKWGIFSRVKFNASFISSADATKVNSWWGANEPVLLMNADSTSVLSGYLTNDELPIGGRIEGDSTMWTGAIELESF